ncbi:MAG: hypothetical protein ACAH80_08860 [Alphaproteobacteria bacterium]
MTLPLDTTITRALCHSARLVFSPKTEEEAIFIQERLFAMGCAWGDGRTNVSEVASCVAKGILVDHGKIYYNPNSDPKNILCRTDQLDSNYVPPDKAFLIEQFNKVHARLEAIEKRLKVLEEPEPLDKLPLKRPKA